ncbi:alkaline phosphatase family protein [Oceanidesulfovibrio marinus]|uniref:Alkaline phosphatase family protein n=1 Tax=Oceanidesulfovibrio marinus TaxID=370038 RepID=A0A6P1ZG57_9BACT|nr:alkaline phosphatase family protein [Oceanidesulfovibrio marinus]TVM33791.1 alkaline phosphatase family protein [Oceanidesulfovibrio marinus]
MADTLILVLIDGLGLQSACEAMGYMNALCEARLARLHPVRSELPSLSRPLYECILTGARPVHSGIVDNAVVRLSTQQSVFHLAANAGLRTAAAAYYFISELYNESPYNAVSHRFQDDTNKPIQHGCFYDNDSYPDDHLLLDAEYLRRRHDPHFLLIHPMNVDDAGHREGGHSPHYRNTVRRLDSLLSLYMPAWLEQGYQVMVTSDHGVNGDCTHGGTLPQERDVPLFVAGDRFNLDCMESPDQTMLCGLACDILGIEGHGKPTLPGFLR